MRLSRSGASSGYLRMSGCVYQELTVITNQIKNLIVELKDFISETIKQITDGVLEGSRYIKEKSDSREGIRDQYTSIDFDIAISTNEENKDELGGKVTVVQVFSAGASNSKSSSTTNQSRIKFTVSAAIKTS